ncbi:MAG: CDP-alcohol phosphatidyltransferase family protein [Gemmataceae bacterium]|nr:CDP-alcohol phosphatidyltransferase family protein [Gemmata sp.]MDW8197439.1 CDP-alcohol phosphatidyltransferase family protein [Gemmataceae bacterium]
MNYRLLIPNLLSAARIVLGAAFPFSSDDGRLFIIVLAMLSDGLDGLAARWLQGESDVGRWLDPIADKFFVLMVTATLLAEGTLHPLWLMGIAARDITVMVGLLVVVVRPQWLRWHKFQPSWWGKSTTAAQFVVLLVLVVKGSAPVWLLTITTLVSLGAAINYAMRFVRHPRG